MAGKVEKFVRKERFRGEEVTVTPSRRSYRGEEGRGRRGPLKVLLTFLVVLVLFGGILLTVFVVSPDLAGLVPGTVGIRLHELASSGREWLDRLVSETGALGGLRRAAEPLLSHLGLNLPTVLLGLGLLLLAVVCIRILVVTSRPDQDETVDTYPEGGVYGGGVEGGTASPYWPYDGRPGASYGPGSGRRVTAGLAPLPTGSAETSEPGGRPMAPIAGEGRFSVAVSGDAWPLVRPPGIAVSDEAAAGAIPEDAPGPGAGAAEAAAGQEEPFAAAPAQAGSGEPAFPEATPGLETRPAPGLRMTAFGGPEPEVPAGAGSGAFSADEEAAEGVAGGVFGDLGRPAGPAGEPGLGPGPGPEVGPPGGYPSEPYLGDMPEPSYARPAFRRFEEPRPVGPRPAPASFGPRDAGAEAWVEIRPGLGTGLRKFVLPGFLLIALGAGSAYGLQTPYATFFTGGPYGQYLLVSAGVVVSMAVSLWFLNGPMRATVRKTGPGGIGGIGGVGPETPGPTRFGPGTRLSGAGSAFGGAGPAWAQTAAGLDGLGPAVGRFGSGSGPRGAGALRPRLIAPAPVPARAALEGGLEAPDAVDWGRLPKPSIFIPWTQAGTRVGIDIGTAWTKVVQVIYGRDGLEIYNLGLCPTPEGALGEDGVNDPDLLGDMLKDLLTDRNIVQRQVMSALGGHGVIIRHVQFPVMSPDELREVLRWEAEHHIPIPPADAVVDFTVMPGQAEADERGNRQMRVMLVGAQKRVVEAQVAALRRAKLVPKGVDAEALASFRVVQQAGHFVEDPLRYAQAVIDLGHSSTKLGIYLKGALEMSRTLGVGGRTFTSVLVERLKVPEEEAETLKRQYGVRPEGGRVLQALGAPVQDLMFEIRRSFEFFASRHFGQSVRHVYLIGGGARMPGIVEALSRYLNTALGERVPEGAECQVQVIDPLSAVPLSLRLHEQADLIGPEFVTALGLGLAEEEVAHEG